MSPVCAIVGGIAAQEVIKVLSRDADPICNYFVYDGMETYAGFIETVKWTIKMHSTEQLKEQETNQCSSLTISETAPVTRDLIG